MLGNLSHEDARTYFFDYVLPFRKHPPGETEAWKRVYDVCGGNPGVLQLCASKAAALRSWELGARVHRTLLPCRRAEVCCAFPQAATPLCKPR